MAVRKITIFEEILTTIDINMTKHIYILLAFALGLFSVSCQGKKVETAKSVAVADDKEAVNIPVFDAEKAYKNVEKQVSFGPRVPNTAEHRACRE